MTFSQIIDSPIPVLIDFTASWCGPCKTMAPVLTDIKKELGDTVKIVKIDIDESPSTAQTYQVQGVPTFILFKNNRPVWRQSGAMPKSVLLSAIRQFL